VAEELAVDEPKKKASSGAKKKTIPDSKSVIKKPGGSYTVDRAALKTQIKSNIAANNIKRIKLADAEAGAADRPSKVRKVEPKSANATKPANAKAAKFPVFAKGSKAAPKGAKGAAKPRGRPPGALNKKTLARLSTTQQEPQLVQAA